MLRFTTSAFVAASVMVFATCAQAQAYGPPITLEQARKVYAASDAEARKNKWAMTVVIVDSGCNPVLMQKADDAQMAAPLVAQEKAYSACAYKRPTKALQDTLAKGGDGLRYVTFPRMIAADGGLPIVLDGKIIGAIGVSGSAGPDDARVAQAGIDALK
jgi:glc operon protein GlcG